MNNKKLGTAFENFVCRKLAEDGWWVHFMSPDNRGAQPCDIIAVKCGEAIILDCKTSKDHIFRIGRLEDNQVYCFEKWCRCGNGDAYIAVEYKDKCLFIPYSVLKAKGKIDLNEWEFC